jgi:glycosyltransferase involved in cell wall biosynthesis
MSSRADAAAPARGERAATTASTATTRPVRVAFYGNVANNFYQLAKAVRQWPDIDAHLYLDSNDNLQGSPENDDPELSGNYPPWVHRIRPSRLHEKVLPWRRPLVRELAQYDLVLVSGGGPMYASYAGRPVAFFATGGDLTMVPYPLEFHFLHPGFVRKLKSFVLGTIQRRGIKKCDELWILPFPPLLHGFRKLGVSEERISYSFSPLVIDTKRFAEHPDPENSGVAAVHEIRSRFDFSVFHPSRLLTEVPESMKAAGQWKGNDILIRAFAQFLKRTGAKRAGLVLIARPQDVVDTVDDRAAKKLIDDLGIQESVLWLDPPRRSNFTRAELVALYSACDVAAGDFGAGWFGSITLEGLALSRPVIGYVAESALQAMYPWHPLLSSRTVEGNADLLVRLYTDPAFRREKGADGRRWVEEFHSHETAGAMYAERFREMAARYRTRAP